MLGIDFGTSTTEVAAYLNGTAKLLADPDEDTVMPSVVAFLPGGRTKIGRKAKARGVIDPTNTLHSFKRIIGLGWFDKVVAEVKRTQAFEFEQGDQGLPCYRTRAGVHTAEDLARRVFEHVQGYAGLPSSFMGKVVVTAPASFEERQRKAIERAAREAGFVQVALIDEAYAAVLPFLTKGGPREKVLVYDLGGGTFDVAVLSVEGLDYEILSTGGEPFLGGDDLDQALTEWTATKVLEEHQWDIRTSPQSFHNLKGLCQQAKVRLSVFPEAEVPLGMADTVLGDKKVTITRDDLQQPLYELLQGTFSACDDVLHQAGLVSQQVDKVVMVGGSTYLPPVQEAVASYFGRPPVTSRKADCQVALGACLHAALQPSHRVA